MVLPSSGQISLLSLQNEFGGSNPIGIDEYYSSGGAPGSGQIGINTFYGRFANWTDYMMGYSYTAFFSNANFYSGNIVVPGSSRSPTTFAIYFDRFNESATGSLSIYVNEVLNSTYTNGAVGNINVGNPSISFGNSNIRFSSTITDNDAISSNGSTWNVSVGGTSIYYHRYDGTT